MGCQRKGVLDGEIPVDTTAVPIVMVPLTACEGQMTFKNVGLSNLKVVIGRTKNTAEVTAKRYSIALGPNEAFSEEGIVPGQVAAIGDAVGGFLSYYISFKEGAPL